ncbi:MAG: formate C-acetyltransferase/glycerol dehydratase family glycyl radical enzyme, partial [Erysipelotrichaceae bacterium]|nr:formate C-acetyltransferase/glycerol dehydratase family glycyl radical enzyme [Erysipelotrichaceae bacterium]
MNHTNRFGTLTPRMAKYREDVLEKKPYIDALRAVLATESYKETTNLPTVIRRARMLENILKKTTIYIEEETLLVGNQASGNKDAPIFPEYTLEFVMKELDLFEKRDGDVFYITEETKQQLRNLAPFWENNNLRAKGMQLLPDEVDVYMETGFFGMEGKLNAGDAHLAVDYSNILKNGLVSYKERVERLKSELDLCDSESISKYQFYKAVLIVLQAVKDFSQRYADLARQQAQTATESRKAELLEIARICEKVPYYPAETLHEALQAVWILQVALQLESNGHSVSFGRFDQYMNPYLQHDLNNGILTEDKAVELLTNLWIKTLTINKVRSQSHTFSSAGSPMYQNVTIGGQTEDHKDAVNQMSFLVLKSVGQTRLTQPNLTV